MVLILIRRYALPDKEHAFLEAYRKEAPENEKGFIRETLTKIDSADNIPYALKGGLPIKPNCINYINIAEWESWEHFDKAFGPKAGGFAPEIEAYPRERAVLTVNGGHEAKAE